MVGWFEYVDTKEVRLIQGIFGAPVRIPLVKVEVDIAGRREKLLCGMVERLLPGVSILIGNDYSELFPLSLNVATRARMNGCDSDVVHSEVASQHTDEDRQSSVINDCAVSSEVRRAMDNSNESTHVSNNDVGVALGADSTSLIGINGSHVDDVSKDAVCLNKQQPVRRNGLNGSQVGQVRSSAVQQNTRSEDNCVGSMNARMQADVHVVDNSKQVVNAGLDISKSQLIQLQTNDATLVKWFGLAKGISDLNGSSQCVLRDWVLMRLWCDRHRPSDIPIKQIVVPVSYSDISFGLE